jgi:hypothetical protein
VRRRQRPHGDECEGSSNHLDDLRGEVVVVVVVGREAHRFVVRRVGFGLGDEAVGDHLPENPVAAAQRGVEVVDGGVVNR